MPIDLLRAIEHAQTVLNWQENLMSDEMPPEWMWTVDHELEAWFDRVEDDRKKKYGGGKEGLDPDDEGVVTNELAAGRR